MPVEQEDFRNGVASIFEVVMFENWLRFYFIREDRADSQKDANGHPALRIEVPAGGMEKIAADYPDLLPLAEAMNGRDVDFETSRRAVLMHVLNNLDNRTLPKGMAESVFSSSTFQLELHLFNAWEQLHESQLDRGFMDFKTWRELYEKWKEQPGTRELAAKIAGRAV